MAILSQVFSHIGNPGLWQRLGTIFGTSLLLLMVRVGGAGVGVLLQVMIARYYGADILGNYFFAFGLAAVLSIILTAGFPWIVAPVVASSEADGNPGLLRAFLRTAHRHLIATSALIAVPAGAVIWFYPNISNEIRWALLFGVATAPIFAMMRLNGGVANARKRFLIAYTPELLVRPLLLLCVIGLAAYLSLRVDSAVIVASNLVITLVLTVWMSLVLSRHLRGKIASEPDSKPAGPQQSRQWRKLAVPMVLATLFVNLFADLDILMVGSIMSPRETGIFGVSIKITFLMAFAVQIVHQVMLRDASDAHLRNDRGLLRSTVKNANRFALSITISGLVFLVLFGVRVLEVFGEEFTEGYVCVIGLMIAQVIRAAAGPAIQVLMITGNQRASIPVYAASILVLLVSNLVFVPAFGYTGAAAAVIITTVFWAVALNRIVRRTVQLPISIFAK
jgi:O-antigen/teichoic acid export membrane protein